MQHYLKDELTPRVVKKLCYNNKNLENILITHVLNSF